MRSSSARAFRGAVAAAVAFAMVSTTPTVASADPPAPAQGFAVNRFYPSAPGGGWLAMDTLDLRGGLGGAASLTIDYAHDSFHVGGPSGGAQRVGVVQNQAFADFGFAVTYDWLRFYMNLKAPLVSKGTSGDVGGHTFAEPNVDLAQNPDTLSDSRFGIDARLLGHPTDAFRLGAGVQLIVPSANRFEYLTDGTYRAMGRALVAGDLGEHGVFTYAGHLGVHVRPLDEPETPGSPRGSELLFGAGAGWKTLLGASGGTALVVGPEIYGASPFKALFGGATTALEGMLVGRVEGTDDDGAQLRFKTAIGTGLVQQFGAPDFRFVIGIEVFDHRVDTDDDGVSDSQDACPHLAGVKTRDAKTNGCPPLTDVPPSPPPPSPSP